MTTLATPARYTPDDLLTMEDGDRYELEDGRLVERDMSVLSGFVAGLIYRWICSYCERTQSGWPFPADVSYQCFPDHPNRVRKPDVSFIRRDRLSMVQLSEQGHCQVAPDLVVEVLSPRDTAYEVDAKVRIWLNAGVPLVWVVNPDQRTLEIHRTSGSGTILHETDEVSGEGVLSGFQCRLARFFQLEEGQTSGQ